MRWLMFALLLTAPGCKQGVGDRCNVDADCDDGLICDPVHSGRASPASGGTCIAPGTAFSDMTVVNPTDL
jgi:hypothetical protein